MPRLAELQRDFAAFLLGPRGGPASPALPAAVRATGASGEERLAIYKNNVYSRLIDALAATFPAVERLVGEAFFRYAAHQYIARHRPRSPALLHYGDRFPEFLARFAPAASVPYLADVAELELKWLEAYHAAEARAATPATFRAALGAPDAAPAVILHPSARLMRSRYPVSRIWALNRRDEPIPAKTRIPGEAERLLVIRPQADVEVRRVSPGAFAALEALAAGRALSRARAAAERAEPGVDFDAQLTQLAAGESFCLRETAP